MARKGRYLAVMAVAACGFAQRFEVATVKVNTNPPQSISLGGGPPLPPPPPEMRATPGGVTVARTTLQYVLQWAYEMRPWQISGPDWMRSQRYDIVAKTAVPVETAQLRKMLQTLLVERFRMGVRREMRDAPVMALVVAKGGPRLTQSTSEGNPAISFSLPSGPLPGGSMHWDCQRASLKVLEGFLSTPDWDPVVEMTGLTGGFDFKFTRPQRDPENPGSWLGDVQASLQDQLGLKLERRRAPLEYLLIDKAEKTPIEN
jgi:uncharacterized protein (TIGR03435 family)